MVTRLGKSIDGISTFTNNYALHEPSRPEFPLLNGPSPRQSITTYSQSIFLSVVTEHHTWLTYALAHPQSLPFSGIESISKHHPKLFCCQMRLFGSYIFCPSCLNENMKPYSIAFNNFDWCGLCTAHCRCACWTRSCALGPTSTGKQPSTLVLPCGMGLNRRPPTPASKWPREHHRKGLGPRTTALYHQTHHIT